MLNGLDKVSGASGGEWVRSIIRGEIVCRCLSTVSVVISVASYHSLFLGGSEGRRGEGRWISEWRGFEGGVYYYVTPSVA